MKINNQSTVTLLIFALLIVASCKKEEVTAEGVDINKIGAYIGTPLPKTNNNTVGFRALINFKNQSRFYVNDDFTRVDQKFYNESGNDITQYLITESDELSWAPNLSRIRVNLDDDNYLGNYNDYPSTGNNMLFESRLSGWNRPNPFSPNQLYGNEEVITITATEVITEPITKIGSEEGSFTDPYGNTVYLVENKNLRYIKKGGGILDLGIEVSRSYYGVDGHVHLYTADFDIIRIDGITYSPDTIKDGDFRAQDINFYNKYVADFDIWYDKIGRYCDLKNQINGQLDPSFGKIIQTETSNAHVFALAEVNVGKNKLWKIDPKTGTGKQIAADYDITDYIVNGDGGGVFYGVNFNNARPVVAGFSSSGSVTELYEISTDDEISLVNCALPKNKSW